MSDKKRSIGVTIFAVLIILSTALALLYTLNPKCIKLHLESFLKPYGIILYILIVVLSLFEITLGINILRLKEWARRFLVKLMIFYIGLQFLMPIAENKEFIRSQEKSAGQLLEMQEYKEKAMASFEEDIKKYPPEKQETLKQTYSKVLENAPRIGRLIIVSILNVIFFLWYLTIIFFFTRPKVKEQFKFQQPNA